MVIPLQSSRLRPTAPKGPREQAVRTCPAPPPYETYSTLIDLALAEDIGPGDVTSARVIPSHARTRARIEAREDLSVAGLFLVQDVVRAVDPEIRLTLHAQEGERVSAGQVLVRLEGSVRGILAAERTALNFLGRMCGIASLTRRYVDTVAHTACEIVDTRKTLPGWRALDKFAVVCGGGTNHRFALYDGILLKDNDTNGGLIWAPDVTFSDGTLFTHLYSADNGRVGLIYSMILGRLEKMSSGT